MTPINRKVLITGSAWEMRVKLTTKTKEQYNYLKARYEQKLKCSLSASAFVALLLNELHTTAQGTEHE